MSYVLVLINIIVFILIRNQRLDSEDLSSSYHMVFNRRQYYRIITAAFTHEEPLHLLFNMISLVNVGTLISAIFGDLKMLLIYFGSMIAGKFLALQIRHNRRDDYTMSLGASGAISGLIGAYLYFVTRRYGLDGLMSMMRPLVSLAMMSMLPGVDGTSHVCGLSMGMLLGWLLLR